MFGHNFKYSVKVLFKNKMLIFWTFIFPIILGTFFNMAFSDIESSEKLDIIDIAVIDNEDFQTNEVFRKSLENLGDKENEDRIFDIKYVEQEEASKMLEDSEITGYLLLDEEDVKITINSNGINETILKYVVDEIKINGKIVEELLQKEAMQEYASGNYNVDYEKIAENILDKIENSTANLNDVSNSKLSYTMIEYYTLIAMTCLYGGILSMFIVNYKLPNMKSVGKRTAVSPIHKGKMLLGSLLASYVVQLIGLLILFLYTIFVLKVDFGTNLPLIILLACIGSFAGLSIGVAVATLIKSNENAKTGILIAITMFGCFLSGMMGITMKYIVDKNIPILNKINPASMITDGFYSLYYYANNLDRYYFNIISLVIFSAILIIVSLNGLRRQKYDSI